MPEDMPNHKDDDLVNDTSVKFLDRAITDHHGNIKNFRTAYRQQKGGNPGAGVVFLTGFKSDMDGSSYDIKTITDENVGDFYFCRDNLHGFGE